MLSSGGPAWRVALLGAARHAETHTVDRMVIETSTPARAAGFAPILARAREVAADILAPRANRIDQSEQPPIDNFRALAGAGLLGLNTPICYGGLGAPSVVVHDCVEILAAACGVTTFLLERHLSAVGGLVASANEALKQEVLPWVAGGQRLLASAATHLRPDRPSTLRAEPDGDGFRLDGGAPWVSGWGLMTDVLLGGRLPDGRRVYVLAPFVRGENLQVSEPMRLCAMTASATVSLRCHALRVDSARCLGVYDSVNWGQAFVALTRTSKPLGVVAAAIGLIRELVGQQDSAVLAATATALDAELAAVRGQVAEWATRAGTGKYRAEALRLIGWSHELSVRAALAAVVASGGRANDRQHAAQRLYREAMFYSVYLQRAGVKEATLERLARLDGERGA